MSVGCAQGSTPVAAGRAGWELTEPGGPLDPMSPAAPGAQLQWNFTASCLPEAWITRTRDLPAGVVSWSSRIFSCAAWPFALRAAAVYALPPWTVTSADRTGRLDAADPAARILML